MRSPFIARISPTFLLLLLLTSVPACGPAIAPPTPQTAVKVPSRTETTYELKGEVLRIDLRASSVLIHHEAIQGFMPSMRMPFQISDPKVLEGLKVGDKIRGSLVVINEGGTTVDYHLTDIEISQRPIRLEAAKDSESAVDMPRRLEPGEFVPDFTMTTQDGTSLKLSDLRGKVVVITFIYTRCPLPDFCPLLDQKFGALAQRLEAVPDRAKQVRLLSVSFDPEHDTPEVLRKHALIRGAKEPLWTFAVASHPELAKVAAPLGLAYGPRSDDIIHNLTAAIIDQNGKLVDLKIGKSWTSADLFKTIYSQIASPRS